MNIRKNAHRIAFGLMIVFAAMLLSTAAFAGMDEQKGSMLNGDEITDLIAGNTITGSMSSGQQYAEFYAKDGTIHGDGYTGTWSIDGDAMCFDYGEGPDCYEVAADGQSVQWILDGEVDGTGTVRDGNPLDF